MMRTLGVSALLVAALSAPTRSHADIFVFTSQASYLAAIASPGVDTFDDLPGTALAGPLNRSAGAYTYRATISSSPGSFDFFPAGTSTDRWLSTNNARATITFDTFSSGVRGVGGFFFGSDIAGSFLAGQSITVTATSGAFTSTQTLTNTTTSTFLGFVSTGAFDSVSVVGVQGTTTNWPAVNNLTLGVSAIPEPGPLALGATAGVLGLAASLRRRRAA